MLQVHTNAKTTKELQVMIVAYLRDMAKKRRSQKLITTSKTKKKWCDDTAAAMEEAAAGIEQIVLTEDRKG